MRGFTSACDVGGAVFASRGVDGGVYLLVGSTNRRADRVLVEELRLFARAAALDEQPMPGLDSEALDFRAASESVASRIFATRVRRAETT